MKKSRIQGIYPYGYKDCFSMKSSFQIFNNISNFRYGMSTRADGSMLLPERSRTQATQKNHDTFFRKEGIDPASIVSPLLTAGNNVAVVTEADRGTIVRNVDGLITDRLNIVLTVTIADCLPIFLHDPDKHVIGLVHAGWKGLAANVVAAAIDTLEQTFDANPLDLLVTVGPSIGPCHYEVGNDVAEKFFQYPDAIQRKEGKIFLDLRFIAVQQCLALAVRPEHIVVSSECTYENETLFSARRDKKEPVEAMVAYIVQNA